MKKQNYELKNEKILQAFEELKSSSPAALENGLNLSWSNWGFGMEFLADSAGRLEKNGIRYIELHFDVDIPDSTFTLQALKP